MWTSYINMSVQKITQLDSSVQLLKEKDKSHDLTHSNLTARLNSVEQKLAILVNNSSQSHKENLNSFELELSSSHIFANSLKKVDSNTTANLKRLEDYFGSLILQNQHKFSQIEQKMIGMMTQKQKILRNMSFQIDNQQHSITAIEEWIRSDHQQVNSFHIVEENLRQKVDLIQKNQDIKMEILEQKLKYLEQSREITQNGIKNMEQELQNSIKGLKHDVKTTQQGLTELRSKSNVEKDSSGTNNQMKKLKDEVAQILRKVSRFSQEMNDLEDTQTRLTQRIKTMEDKQHQFKSSPSQLKPPQQNERMHSSTSLQPVNYESNAYDRKPSEQTFNKASLNNEPQKQKKSLPQKKNIFSEQVIQTPEEDTHLDFGSRGGTYDILRNTKQKGKELSGQKRGRSSLAQRRGLPPVREGSSSKKKRNQKQSKIRNFQPQQDGQQEIVYQIDEEGYLMDETGNYLQDEYGNLVKLSPEEIQQYVQQ